MKLNFLQLTNFKGIKDFRLGCGMKDVSVYGTNAAGKTTLADAFTWLLCDKPSTDEVGFSPKPKDKAGAEIHFLDTTVEAELVSDLKQIRLKKTLREIWTKKRGHTEQTYGGNTVDYFLNDVPVRKTDYDAAIAEIMDPAAIPIMTKPFYFAERLPWQERRKILMAACNAPSPEDIEIEGLKELLNGHTVEEYRAIAKAELKKIDARIEDVPVRIDEATKSLSGTDPDQDISTEADEKSLAALQKQLVTETADQALEDAKRAYWRAAEDYDAENRRKQAESDMAERQLKADRDLIAGKLTQIRGVDIPAKERLINSMEVRRADLLEEYAEAKESVWSGETVCPTCGQDLPEDQIEKAKATFNVRRSETLTRIREMAEKECSKALISGEKAKLEALRAELATVEAQLSEADAKWMAARSATEPAEPFERTERGKSLLDAWNALKQATALPDNSLLLQSIEEVKETIAKKQAAAANIRADVKTMARIEELEKEMKDLQIQHEERVLGLKLCEDHTRKLIETSTDYINSFFTSVRFKLFQAQINGGIAECCEVMVPGAGSLVEFKSANNAARISAGLELIENLSGFYEEDLPVFVDNAESIVNVGDHRMQIIRLVVSESDPVLRVEIN